LFGRRLQRGARKGSSLLASCTLSGRASACPSRDATAPMVVHMFPADVDVLGLYSGGPGGSDSGKGRQSGVQTEEEGSSIPVLSSASVAYQATDWSPGPPSDVGDCEDGSPPSLGRGSNWLTLFTTLKYGFSRVRSHTFQICCLPLWAIASLDGAAAPPRRFNRRTRRVRNAAG